MSRSRRHIERHAVDRIGWLRAAVLGANDGIVSTASLIIRVAAANATRGDLLIAGTAGSGPCHTGCRSTYGKGCTFRGETRYAVEFVVGPFGDFEVLARGKPHNPAADAEHQASA